MAKTSVITSITLASSQDEVKINLNLWAETLVLAENYGWKPTNRRTSYLADNTCVSRDEAHAIADGLENLFEEALRNPLAVLPVRVDMDDLYEIKEFLTSDGCVIRYE